MYKENINNLTITPETKISELLEAYPYLEDKLIELAPAFSKLKNPLLRKTIIKVASIRQAATVGGLHVTYLINKLRNEAGQNQETFNEDSTVENSSEFSFSRVKEIYDATNDLEEGKHPLAKVMNGLKQLSAGECFLLITPFIPAPLIEKVREKGFHVRSDKTNSNSFENYFWR